MAKDGKDLERLVQLIEKSIAPDSKVEFDVNLPVLTSTIDATRQCDVVVTSGKPPRETVTVIEIQDRTRKVERGTFGGWMEKLAEVGAQHLICVSRHPFTESIREKAQQSGGSVRLVTLRSLDADEIPLDKFTMHFTWAGFDITKISLLTTSRVGDVPASVRDAILTEHKGKLNINDPIFSLDQRTLVSAYKLCRVSFKHPDGEISGTGNLVFKLDEEPALYIHHADKAYRIGLDCDFEWTHTIETIPASLLAYEQGEDGALAWVYEYAYDSPKGRVELKVPVAQFGDGHLVPGAIVSLPPETELHFGTVKRRDS